VLEGGDGDDTLNGSQGDDRLEGGNGQDVALYMGAYGEYDISYDSAANQYTIADRMPGRDGTDLVRDVENFHFADGPRTVTQLVPGAAPAGPAFTITGTAGDDYSLYGTLGDDRISGLDGHDSLFGETGNDELLGGEGHDSLRGGEGNDLLAGGAGWDYLVGAGGADRFVFGFEPYGSIDKVADFTAGLDKIVLEQGAFPALAVGNLSAGAFQSGAVDEAMGTATRILLDTRSGGLYYDPDGAGGYSATMFGQLDMVGLVGVPSAADFVVN
jgi:Ca2+-binding RTX toxin-like protein